MYAESSSLDKVEFLARSPTRITVLDAVREKPRARHELREIADGSRVTLSRILADLEDQGWVVRANGEYQTTPRGALVAAEFTQLLANIDAAEELDEVLWWLPTDQFGFDLACLRDATVSVQGPTDHTAATRHVTALVRNAKRVRGVATGVSHEVVDAVRELVVDRGGQVQLVLEAGAIEFVRTDAGLRQRFREMLESGHATVYRYDGDDSLLMLLVTDDTVVFCGHDDNGPPPGTLETTDPSVHAWAESYVSSVRADAQPVDVEAFTP